MPIVTPENADNFIQIVPPNLFEPNAEGVNIFRTLVDLDISVLNQIGQVNNITASAVSIGGSFLLTAAHNIGNVFEQGYAPPQAIAEYQEGLTINEGFPFASDLDFSAQPIAGDFGIQQNDLILLETDGSSTLPKNPILVFIDPNEATGQLTAIGYPGNPSEFLDLGLGFNGELLFQAGGTLELNSYNPNAGPGTLDGVWTSDSLFFSPGFSGGGIWLDHTRPGSLSQKFLIGIVSTLDLSNPDTTIQDGFYDFTRTFIEPLGDSYQGIASAIFGDGTPANPFTGVNPNQFATNVIIADDDGNISLDTIGTGFNEEIYGRDNALGDNLYGGGGSDILYSQDGDDLLDGGSGNDELYGGSGFDTADYSAAGSGIVLDTAGLSSQQVSDQYLEVTNDGFGQTDTLQSIEKIIATDQADQFFIRHNNAINWLEEIDGRGGVDTLDFTGVETLEDVGVLHFGSEHLKLSGIENILFGDFDDHLSFSVNPDMTSEVVIDSGDGDNTVGINYDTSGNLINPSADSQTVITANGGDGDDFFYIDGETITVNLTSGNNQITATAQTLVTVTGGDGSNTVTASAETVIYNGAAGGNTVNATADHAELNGGDAINSFSVTADTAALYGGMMVDNIVINANNGAVAFGWEGNDTLKGSNAYLFGGAGDDYIESLGGTTLLSGLFTGNTGQGSSGVHNLIEDEERDDLYGGTGNDIFLVGHNDSVERFEPQDQFTLYIDQDITPFLQKFLPERSTDTRLVFGEIVGSDVQAEAVVEIRSGEDIGWITIYYDYDEETSWKLFIARIRGVHGEDYTEINNNIRDEFISGNPSFVSSSPISINAGVTEPIVLPGSTGQDDLTGGIHDDTLDGQGGDDTLDGSYGDDILNGGNGNDVLDGGYGLDTLNGGGDNDTLMGGAGDDLLQGNSGDDMLDGGAGADEIYGASGDDHIMGGNGDDEIFALGGNDMIYGGDGDDVVNSGIGIDTAYGDAGNDNLLGANQSDVMYGGLGNDSLNGNAGNDMLTGDAGADVIMGEAGADELYGGDGADTLYGAAGGDDLFGGNANDTLDSGGGNDNLTGGSGADIFLFNTAMGTDRIHDFEDGVDQIDFSGNSLANDFSDIQATATQVGANIRIELNLNNILVLENFDLANLDASDFIFTGSTIREPSVVETALYAPEWTPEYHLWFAGVNEKYLAHMDADFFAVA